MDNEFFDSLINHGLLVLGGLILLAILAFVSDWLERHFPPDGF